MEIIRKPVRALSDNFPGMVIASITIAWGLMLFMPLDTFSVSQGYNLLAASAPEAIWGLAFMVAGAFNLHGQIVNKPRWVAISSRVLMFMWMVIALAFVFAAPASANWPVFLGLALMFGWLNVEHTHYRRG
jgi:hypothetical protein